MANKQHNILDGADMHIIHAYTYADATARTSAGGFVAGDVGKVAKQTDNNSYWILQTTAPVWSQLNGDDHGALTGLLDDDHTQYLRLLGRAGGQTAYGGTLATQTLRLAGNPIDKGRVYIDAPLEITDVLSADTTALRYRPTFTATAAYIGGFAITEPDVTIDPGAGIFIPTSLGDRAIYRVNTTLRFAAYTYANLATRIVNVGNFNLLNALVFNVGIVHERATSGTSSASITGMNFSPQTRASANGAICTKIAQRAVIFAPTFSTVNGATANLGPLTGILGSNPAAGFLQPSSGVETMISYVLVDMLNITFGGNVTKAAVRSAQAAATNAFFLLQTGAAQSRFVGQVQHRSNTLGSKWGTADDFGIRFNGSEAEFEWSGGDSLLLDNIPAFNYWRLRPAAAQGLMFEIDKISFGDVAPLLTRNWTHAVWLKDRATNFAGEWTDDLIQATGPVSLGHAMTVLAASCIREPQITRNAFALPVACTLWVDTAPTEGDENFGIYAPTNRHILNGYQRRGASYAGYN